LETILLLKVDASKAPDTVTGEIMTAIEASTRRDP
jgi:hypothetical protein